MANPIVTKQCYKCKQTLERSLFHRHKNRPDGLQEICKACKAAYFQSTYRSQASADFSERENEEWRPVVGFEAHYSVSNQGRVKRTLGSPGAVKGRVLRCGISPQGYRLAHMTVYNRTVARFVHTLVAAAFIGPRPKGLAINHKDGNKLNNSPDNLEYVTTQENCLHAIRNHLRTDFSRPPGTVPRGETHSNAKLTNQDVITIRALLASGHGGAALAKCFGVSRSLIYAIKRCGSWSHI